MAMARAFYFGTTFVAAACLSGTVEASTNRSAIDLAVLATATSFPLTSSTQFGAPASYSLTIPTGVYEIETSNPIGGAVTPNAGVRISYDSQRGTYTLQLLPLGLSVTTSRRFTTSGVYDVYVKNTAKFFDQVKLYNGARTGISPVPLTYVSFGMWAHQNKTTGATTQTAMVFGYLTPNASIPRSGSASYQTMVHGSSTIIGTNAGTRDVGGSATFTADFANETVATDLNLSYIQGSTQTPIGSFSGSGYMYSQGGFGGSFESDTPYFVYGTFTGGFYGPNAAEMGYTFGIQRHNADPYAGAAPYYLDEAIVGTVVGRRQ